MIIQQWLVSCTYQAGSMWLKRMERRENNWKKLNNNPSTYPIIYIFFHYKEGRGLFQLSPIIVHIIVLYTWYKVVNYQVPLNQSQKKLPMKYSLPIFKLDCESEDNQQCSHSSHPEEKNIIFYVYILTRISVVTFTFLDFLPCR